MLENSGGRGPFPTNDTLVEDIVALLNGRTVVIDACVSREIVRKLADKGVSARHVTDLNPQMTDKEIEFIMLPSDVLITKDVNFARSLRERAILLPLQAPGSPKAARARKTVKAPRARLPKDIRVAVKEQVAKETSLGIIQLKIVCGLFMIFEMRIITIEEVREMYRLVRYANA